MEKQHESDVSNGSNQHHPTNQPESMEDNEATPEVEVRIQIDSSIDSNNDSFQSRDTTSSKSDLLSSTSHDAKEAVDTTLNSSPPKVIITNHDTMMTDEGSMVVTGGEGDDDEDDFDDCIDIRDNANDEDEFAFEENNGSNSNQPGDRIPNTLQQSLMNEMVPTEESNGDDHHDNVDNNSNNQGIDAATNSVPPTDDDHLPYGYHYDHHHLDDHYHGSPSGSYEEDSNEYYQQEKSLDVLLLEEICEEAANMTIKEALIHSLKPNVRAGLTTAHLRLSESEILALEGYCEDFVGGLIKDLLKRTALLQNTDAETQKNVVQAAAIKSTAKHLSSMDLKQLKVYCDHFVHNVIAESIIDSSMIVAKQQQQADQVKELLQVFQDSEELQEYFTSLTTDIVRTALINVVSKGSLEETESQSSDQQESSTLEGSELTSYSGDQDVRSPHGDEDFDFDDDHNFGLPNAESPVMQHAHDNQMTNSDKEFSPNGRTKHAKQSPRLTMPQHGGDTSLEFDMDWVEGALQNINGTSGLQDISGVDGERRQKIVMRELDFDDRVNVGGTELLAPVFLAIAEENEDDSDFQGMRRKTQSIEDLCELIEEQEPPRRRSSSLDQARSKRKPQHKRPMRPRSYHQETQLEQKVIVEDESEPSSPDLISQTETQRQSPRSFDVTRTLQEKMYHAYDDEQFRWHTIRVNNREKVLDLRLIEPYMKVITHGGVHMPSRAVIVVIAACYLPEKSKRNYDFLMEQLFFYLISTLELLATADEYFLVYFNGGTTQSNMPALPWMKRFYQHIEGGLKQNMIKMFIVHPNLWLKTVVRFAKAFVGTNFWSKLEFIKTLDDLSLQIPTEFMYIPDEVIRCDPKYKRLHNL